MILYVIKASLACDMDLIEISAITQMTEQTIEFLWNRNLLHRNWMCCRALCTEVRSKSSDQIEFRCLHCFKRHSIRSNSIFFNVHLRLTYLLLLIYLFATNTSVTLAMHYIGRKISRKTVTLFFHKLRVVMSDYLVPNPIRLGGPNSVVEIDETCLGRKRKYNRGAFRGSGQKWVIGFIDRQSQKCHIQFVLNRTRDTLLPIIESGVAPDTVIHTDEAPVYAILNQRGFEHYTVCHCENYVAPDGTHMNCIEGLWSHLKQVFKEKRGVPNDKLPAHLDVYLPLE